MSDNTQQKPLHDLDDQALVTRVQTAGKGRNLAFCILLSRHQDGLLRHCLARLGNRHDAEDAVQETVLRAYRGICGFKGDASFRTWLHVIADNQCNTLAVRRSKQIMSDHLKELVHQHESGRIDWRRPSESLTCSVHKTLSDLPDSSRDVLMLRFFCDLRIEQIASLLGIGLSAAKMRLYRAQAQFSESYGAEMAA
jgi:RNA polymerase sigma-70 factor (ECF subfamily)